MRYVERDQSGVVVGHYANPQPGYAEEAVQDDAPELLVFRVRPVLTPEQRRDAVARVVDDPEGILRAAVLTLLDELNLHSDRLAAVLQAAAGASTLAQLKTAMALVQPIPQRTPAQVRAAIRAKLGA